MQLILTNRYYSCMSWSKFLWYMLHCVYINVHVLYMYMYMFVYIPHLQSRSRGAARRPPSRRALRESGSGSDRTPSESLTASSSSLGRLNEEAPPPTRKKTHAAALPITSSDDPFADLLSESPPPPPPSKPGEANCSCQLGGSVGRVLTFGKDSAQHWPCLEVHVLHQPQN